MSLAATFEAHCGIAHDLAFDIAGIWAALANVDGITAEDWPAVEAARSQLRQVISSLAATGFEIDEQLYRHMKGAA